MLKNKEVLAENLRKLLKRRGMSVRSLAAKVDMPRSNISRLLSGEHSCNLSTLDRLASGLEVKSEELLKGA